MRTSTAGIDPEALAALADLGYQARGVAFPRSYPNELRLALRDLKLAVAGLRQAEKDRENAHHRQTVAIEAWREGVTELAAAGLPPSEIAAVRGSFPPAVVSNQTYAEISAVYAGLVEEREAIVRDLLRSERDRLIAWLEASPHPEAQRAIATIGGI
jgi:hypothetical protein